MLPAELDCFDRISKLKSEGNAVQGICWDLISTHKILLEKLIQIALWRGHTHCKLAKSVTSAVYQMRGWVRDLLWDIKNITNT